MAESDSNGLSESGWIEATDEVGSTPEDAAEGQHEGSEGDDPGAEADLAQAVEQTLAEDDEPDESDTDEADSPNREAAKWRHKLREVEAERDQLAEQVETLRQQAAGQVEALQRQAVAHLVGDRLHDVGDLWSKHDLGDLLGEDGSVDAAAVDAAIGDLPAHFRKAPEPLYTQGFQGKGEPKGPSWGDVLGGR